MTQTTGTTLIFTYGSLMSGLGNHVVMKRAQGAYVCDAQIKGLRLHAYCSSFPAAYRGEEDEVIKGEVYRVNKSGLAQLDQLEGEGHFYHRIPAKTVEGDDVQVYILIGNTRGAHIPSGDWREFKRPLNKFRGDFGADFDPFVDHFNLGDILDSPSPSFSHWRKNRKRK